jgi:Protein of unknown function (DUF3048) N-terminal domain/Protein of unknown function (DUF3048) C-terminal domain
MQLTPRNRMVLAGVGLVLLAAAVVVVLLLTGAFGAAQASPTPEPSESATPTASPTPSPTPEPTATPTPRPRPSPVGLCPYNGVPVYDASALERPAMLVQVENNPNGRPTSGLNSADLVVEAPVEGDTTRFGAVYLCGDAPEAIGPVRSARYYNVDLWRQLHEITMHFGAGTLVLEEFNRTGMPYVNGISGGWAFFARVGPRPAPHNVYFDLEGAREAAAAGRLGSRVERAGQPQAPFTFEPDVAYPPGRAVASTTIFTNAFWNFGWTWEPSTTSWVRSDDGALATDALTGSPLRAKTVVVQRVTETVLPGELDPGGHPRRRQHMVGSGTGVLYADGRAYDIRWSRPSDNALTTWTYADSGEPVVLQPGRVWWEIVPIGSTINDG